MGGHARRVRPWDPEAVTVNPGLAALVESGELDWDNPRHREAYLRAWVNGTAPAPRERPEGEPDA